MNITRENTGDLTATLKININESDYQDRVQKQLKDYQKGANVPGFRKGQVPFGYVNRLYGKAVLVEEIQKILDENLQNYVKEEKLNILGGPLSNNEKTGDIDFSSQKDYDFYFDIAIQPEIMVDLSKMKVDMYNIQPDDKMIDSYLSDTRERYGKFETPETTEDKDIVYGEMKELDENDEIKEDGLKTFSSFNIETISLAKIRKQFVGKKKDDTVNFKFNEAFKKGTDVASILRIPQEEAEKFEANVCFSISGISRVTPHELNEEFFKKIFPDKEIKTEEEFREALKENLSKAYEKEAEKKFLNDATKLLVDETKVELPEEFLKRWFLNNQEGNDVASEQIEAEWEEKYIPSLKWQLIEGKIRETNNINVTHEDLKNFVKEQFVGRYLAPAQNEEEEQENEMRLNEMMGSIIKNQEQMRYVYEQLYDEKLGSLLKEKMNVSTKDVSLDGFKELLTGK